LEKLCLLLVAIFAAGSCLASDEAFQISLEIFDENRETTICTYRSRAGTAKVTEHVGRYFCPRVITETSESTDSDEPAAHLFDAGTLVAYIAH
jgi:hypothetical protein